MKKWIVFILLFITAAGTLIPCCQEDDCVTDQLTASPTENNHKKEGACSPFFSCATCPSFVELAKSIQILPPIVEKLVHHEMVIPGLKGYSTAFWQPPRTC